LTQSKSAPDPKFIKHFTVGVEIKINKIRHSPQIQVQSNAHLCGRGVQESKWTPAGVLTNFKNRSGAGVDFFK